MKKFIMAIALCLMCATMSAKAENDTLVFNGNIEKVIVDSTLNSKGTYSKKYYLVVNNHLVDTNKKTQEQLKVAKKFGVMIDLIAIIDKNTKKLKKIIAQ